MRPRTNDAESVPADTIVAIIWIRAAKPNLLRMIFLPRFSLTRS